MEDALYWLWLAGAVGSGSDYAAELLAEIGHPRNLYEDFQCGFALPQTLSRKAVERLQSTAPADYAPLLEQCAEKRIAVLTPDEPDYPDRMRNLPDLPLVLYATGATRCLNGRRYIGMVGTRRPSAYGKQACYDLSLEMALQGAVIVSGLADGLDSEGHKAAVAAGTQTIAFLGTAIDKTFPAINVRLRAEIEALDGAVVSEYPPHYTGRTTGTFLARNRLIAAQSEALCVAEARLRSGTLNTVHHAQRYGARPVLAVPGSIYSPLSQGTNELLHSGQARVLCKAADALDAIGFANHAADPLAPCAPADLPELTADAKLVLQALKATPLGMDEICQTTALSAGRVLPACVELELAGLAAPQPGRRYTAR